MKIIDNYYLINIKNIFRCASYVVEPESTQILQGVLDTYLRFGEYPRALLVAMQLHDKAKCEEVFNACNDL